MRPTRWLVFALAFAAACAEAGGDSTGGNLTPAGAQAATPPVFTPPVADAGSSCGTGGSKWSELYADIFGSVQPGGCVSESTCHGSADSQGALDADGILCISPAGCRQSLIDQRLATPADQANPTSAKLFARLRSLNNPTASDGTDLMPKAPADYVFSQACLDRISAWVANGVPDD